MAKVFKSKFRLTKRYSAFSNICVYFVPTKPIRYGYKLYQKIFKKYRSGQNLRINVRKPRIAVKRKTSFGKALEIKEKFSYLLGGIHSSKLRRYCRVSKGIFRAAPYNLISALERRLDLLLYRSNIFTSPEISQWAIKCGFVTVDRRIKINPAFKVKVNSTINISIPEYFYNNVFHNFAFALKNNLIFKPEPSHLVTSYKLLQIIVSDSPNFKYTFFPFSFNVNFFYRLYSI